jgi:hypothetical protein
MRLLLLALFFGVLGAKPLGAAIHFDRLETTVSAALDQDHADTEFKFTNDGKQPVLIEKITTSCGCTTAQADRKIYLPGESGIVSATVQIGSAQGELDKKIVVETDDADKPTIELTVHVMVPEVVKFEPAEYVRWDQGAQAKPKSVTVTVAAPFALRIVGLKSWNDKVHATLKEIEAGKTYEITAWPTDTSDVINTAVELLTEARWPGEPKKIWLLAHVKPAGQT